MDDKHAKRMHRRAQLAEGALQRIIAVHEAAYRIAHVNRSTVTFGAQYGMLMLRDGQREIMRARSVLARTQLEDIVKGEVEEIHSEPPVDRAKVEGASQREAYPSYVSHYRNQADQFEQLYDITLIDKIFWRRMALASLAITILTIIIGGII